MAEHVKQAPRMSEREVLDSEAKSDEHMNEEDDQFYLILYSHDSTSRSKLRNHNKTSQASQTQSLNNTHEIGERYKIRYKWNKIEYSIDDIRNSRDKSLRVHRTAIDWTDRPQSAIKDSLREDKDN